MTYTIISADSHITEPPDTYHKHVDPRFRDRAPLPIVGYKISLSMLEQMPTAYFRENIYVTFQDDWVAFRMLDMVNPGRIMWANDFPHSDSTWPRSQAILHEHTARLSAEQKRMILHDNVAYLYGLAE